MFLNLCTLCHIFTILSKLIKYLCNFITRKIAFSECLSHSIFGKLNPDSLKNTNVNEYS